MDTACAAECKRTRDRQRPSIVARTSAIVKPCAAKRQRLGSRARLGVPRRACEALDTAAIMGQRGAGRRMMPAPKA